MIQRHKVNLDKIYKESEYILYTHKLHSKLNRLNTGLPLNLHSVRNGIQSIVRSSVIYGHTSYTYTGMKYFVDIGIAHFARIVTDKEEIQFQIGDKVYRILKEESEFMLNGFEWSNVMNQAIIIRDTDTIQKLLSIPVWEIIEYDGPFHRLFSQYQAAVFSENEEERQRIRYMIKENAESNIGLFIGREEKKYIYVEGLSRRIKKIHLPLVDLYDYAIKKDSLSFNNLLEDFLIEKKKYIIEQGWETQFNYWIDFSALAVCAFAYDSGIHITVESEYIPRWVYQGEFEMGELVF